MLCNESNACQSAHLRGRDLTNDQAEKKNIKNVPKRIKNQFLHLLL